MACSLEKLRNDAQSLQRCVAANTHSAGVGACAVLLAATNLENDPYFEVKLLAAVWCFRALPDGVKRAVFDHAENPRYLWRRFRHRACSKTTDQRFDQTKALRRKIDACGSSAPLILACGALLAMAIDAEETDASRDAANAAFHAFHSLPERMRQDVYDGWVPDPDMPDAAALLAAQQLATVVRVLTFTATPRTVLPSLRFMLTDGDSPVRVEVVEGTKLEDVIGAMGRVCSLINKAWQR